MRDCEIVNIQIFGNTPGEKIYKYSSFFFNFVSYILIINNNMYRL